MKNNLILLLLLVTITLFFLSACSSNNIEQEKENSWYQGFYEFCIHAPSQPGKQNSPPMYYESECKDMLQQAKDIDLYNTLIIPTPTVISNEIGG